MASTFGKWCINKILRHVSLSGAFPGNLHFLILINGCCWWTFWTLQPFLMMMIDGALAALGPTIKSILQFYGHKREIMCRFRWSSVRTTDILWGLHYGARPVDCWLTTLPLSPQSSLCTDRQAPLSTFLFSSARNVGIMSPGLKEEVKMSRVFLSVAGRGSTCRWKRVSVNNHRGPINTVHGAKWGAAWKTKSLKLEGGFLDQFITHVDHLVSIFMANLF